MACSALASDGTMESRQTRAVLRRQRLKVDMWYPKWLNERRES
ncbi:hypothetical protein CUJ84_Chr003778 [Rhizobium leguminosarum]|uniref:Uncharacterized protein n=1 Tax=Rhizobium leguminosarum TaxID=384 RepID=A0A2K9Z7A6_RHILE|nr:hypothetical protein CUJ84_Chr003778 [Rhizobium leguminosarum]